MPEGIEIQLQGDGPRSPQAALHPPAQQDLLAKLAVEQEGVTEIGIEERSPPEGGGPGMGVPVRNRRQRCWTGNRLGRRQGNRRRRLGVEVHLTGGEVQHAIDVLHLAGGLDQAEPQTTGLKKLAAALKADTAAGIDRAVRAVVLDPLGHQPTARHQGFDSPSGDIALDQLVESLPIGGDLQGSGWILKRSAGGGRWGNRCGWGRVGWIRLLPSWLGLCSWAGWTRRLRRDGEGVRFWLLRFSGGRCRSPGLNGFRTTRDRGGLGHTTETEQASGADQPDRPGDGVRRGHRRS